MTAGGVDLDAIEAEVTSTKRRFITYKGAKYPLPATFEAGILSAVPEDGDWDWATTHTVMTRMLGEKVWTDLLAAGISLQAIPKFLGAVIAEVTGGMGPGESSASSNGSQSTSRRSRRTSNGSTG